MKKAQVELHDGVCYKSTGSYRLLESPPQSVRITMSNGKRIEINLFEKGDGLSITSDGSMSISPVAGNMVFIKPL